MTQQELEQAFNAIPDSSPDPADTTGDDPADAPDRGEPPDPSDDNANPDEVATPDATPEATPVVTPVATVEAVAATLRRRPSPRSQIRRRRPSRPRRLRHPTPTPTPTPAPVEATATPTPAITPTATAAPTRKVTRRKMARAARPANGSRVHPTGLPIRESGTPAPAAAPRAVPVVRVRHTGQALVSAPPRAGEYVVRRGDTLSAIAARSGMTWPALWALNRDRIADPNLIYPRTSAPDLASLRSTPRDVHEMSTNVAGQGRIAEHDGRREAPVLPAKASLRDTVRHAVSRVRKNQLF